jgi:hypothetical protein
VASASLGGILPGWDASVDADNKSASRGFGGHAEGRHLIFRSEEEGIHGGVRTKKDRFRATGGSYFWADGYVKEIIGRNQSRNRFEDLRFPRVHPCGDVLIEPSHHMKSAKLMSAFRLMLRLRNPFRPVPDPRFLLAPWPSGGRVR